jgi:hypothetical protein
MSFESRIWLTVICVIAIAAGIGLYTHYFSADARRDRRRRRSNLRVSSRVKRPTIKFSVRTRKRRK